MKTICLFFSVVISIVQGLPQSKLSIDSLLTAYDKSGEDTLKVRTLNIIVNYYMYRDIDRAGIYAREELHLSRRLGFESGIALASYQLGVYHYNSDNADSAIFYYQSSYRHAKGLNNQIFMSQALRGLAIIAFSAGDLIRADSINELDLVNAIKFQDSLGMALAYDFKGTINQNKGFYSIALDNVLKGLSLFQRLGDSIRIADCYNHLATLEYNLENHEKSIEYNEIALAIYEDYEDTYYQAQALNDIGIQYLRLRQDEKALEYFDQSLGKSREAKVKGIEASALTNIGATYLQMGYPGKAMRHLEESIALAREINAQRKIAISQNSLAETLIALEQPEKAISYASSALAYATTNENISLKVVALKHLANAKEMLGKEGDAILHLKEIKLMGDSVLNAEKVRKIEELRIAFDLQKKESEITIQKEQLKVLKAEARNDRLSKMMYAVGMFSFITISGLLYFGLNQRIKKNRIVYKKKEELLSQEIDFKKKELASQTLHLVRKNTFIQELKENLERLKETPELFKIEYRRLILLLKRENAEDEDWKVFKSYFSEVHNDFDNKLRGIYPEITEKEIRLASFLRMNLSTKEIASIFSVLPDSVLKSKYRLKRKLNLSKEADLFDYLNEL